MSNTPRVTIRPLNVYEMIDLSILEELTIENVFQNHFEIAQTQIRAVHIKLKKMELVSDEDHDFYTFWVIIDAKTQEAMGLVGFKGLSESGVAEIGYGISKYYEGQGYMTEAVAQLIHWAFETGRCETIIACDVVKTNIGSQKVLLRNGFDLMAERRDAFDYKLEKHKFYK